MFYTDKEIKNLKEIVDELELKLIVLISEYDLLVKKKHYYLNKLKQLLK